MLLKNEKLSCLQLARVPPSLQFKATGVSFLYFCPSEKFSLVILMYLLGKIHIICLKPIIPALGRCDCISVPLSGLPFNLPQAQPEGPVFSDHKSQQPHSDPRTPLRTVGWGSPRAAWDLALIKEEAIPHDLCPGAVLPMYLLLSFSLLWMTMLL